LVAWASALTQAIRDALKSQGKLSKEKTFTVWRPEHLTDAQKADAASFEPGNMLQFMQNAPGHKSGSRLVVAEDTKLPVEHAARFEVYRPAQVAVAAGDRIRITANGKTQDGHRLNNGSLYTVKGFSNRGDLVLDNGWTIGKEWGHWSLGYVVTSHASQGKTVDKVFIGQSSQSFPASNSRQFYVSASRGREQAVVFTDSKKELLKAIERPDEPLSAIDFAIAQKRRPLPRPRRGKHFAFLRRLRDFASGYEPRRAEPELAKSMNQERHYAR
jgi:hypothetical protein